MTERIVSLVPSLTDLVCAFGGGYELVGRTRFCTEPRGEVERIPIVGGTKNPDLERIIAARPTLVLANREENRKEDVEALRGAGLDVLLTDPNTVAEAIAMVRSLGGRLGCDEAAERIARETEAAVAGVGAGEARPRVLVLVWKQPLMVLGCESYGHDLLRVVGADNAAGERPRYPEMSMDEIRAAKPGLILLPDEPYPFKEADAERFREVAPARVVDGKLLWWYGPRMPGAIRELSALVSEACR
jgi:ABC-type hemin transport system substrate-binding protein